MKKPKKYRKRCLRKKPGFGHDHPDTMFAMGSLAITLEELGKHEKARELLEKVLEDNIRLLNPHHPSTITAMKHLANIYEKIGEHEKARDMQKRIIAIKS